MENYKASQIEFNDLKEHWAKNDIAELVSKNIIAGYDDRTFKADNNIRVDEFVKLVVTALGNIIENGEQYWAKPFIDQAKSLGLVKDVEFDKFERPITRGEIARIIVRTQKEENIEDIKEAEKSILDFDDIAEELKQYVLKAYGKGIVGGYQDGSFKADELATRAESAVMVLRMMDVGKRIIKTREGTTYYVDAINGNDTNEGSSSLSWKTLSKAANILNAGDTCVIREGIYRETLVPLNSGTANKPINYKAEAGANVTINGCELINTPWKKHSVNIYKTNIKLPLGDGNQVFVTGDMMIEARWPNVDSTKSNNDWLLNPKLSLATNGKEISNVPVVGKEHYSNLKLSITDSSYDSIDPTGAKIWITPLLHHGWCDYTGDVVSYDYESKTITFDTYNFAKGWEQCNVSYGNGQSNYFLFGKLEFLNSQKEYYYDSNGTLYLYQSGSQKPNDSIVEYKARQYGIDLSKKSYINIEGINLFACSLKTSNSSNNIKINKLEAKYISHWSTIDCNGSSRDLDTGIMLIGNNNEIKNSKVSYSAGNGIVINGKNSKMINNYIHDCNYLGGYTSNVKLYGKNNIIGYNTLLRSGRGVLTGNFLGCKIIHNEIAYANILSSDGACIYLGGLDGGNSEIAYNYIHSHYGEERWGSGIYLDNNTLNFIIHHNFTDSMQLNGPRSHIVVMNNTIIGRGIIADYWMPILTGGVQKEKYPNDGMGTFLFNNIITPKNLINLKRDISPINHSSNWISSENGEPMLEKNGTLSINSPCINYLGAKKIDFINDDVTDGNVYLGAFQYGVEPWKYGYNFSNNIECEYTDIDVSIMNRVKNSSFSTNNLDDWEQILNNSATVITAYDNWWFNENTPTRTGYNALVTNSGSGVCQVISGIKPNSTYTMTAWTRIEKDANAEISVKCGDDTVFVTGAYNSDLNWTLNTLTFKTNANDTTATIYLKNTGFGTVNWDDIGIYLNYLD